MRSGTPQPRGAGGPEGRHLRRESYPCVGPYSSRLLPQVSAARAKRLIPSLAQAVAAVRDLGGRVLEMGAGVEAATGVAQEACSVLARNVATLISDTHRPVTNGRADRSNDLRRVSHGATRLGRQTNHSAGDDHVSGPGVGL